jgi:putative flippase GtrA
MLWTLARSGVTSAITAAAELSTLALLHAGGVPLPAAFALVQVVGITITFTLNKLWVFGAAKSGRLVRETRRSVLVFGGAFVLNTLLPSLGTGVLHLAVPAAYLIGQVIVYATWSFPLNRWWVFPAPSEPRGRVRERASERTEVSPGVDALVNRG